MLHFFHLCLIAVLGLSHCFQVQTSQLTVFDT
ncbi:hypothetical protein GLYMA_13G159301v4 [Glycine max]|nr:hypothetical protein GLYMA_13G159301v4 [Glycine max]KAH1101775.1 hypothetical protein GYH30_036380 [Glycine max]